MHDLRSLWEQASSRLEEAGIETKSADGSTDNVEIPPPPRADIRFEDLKKVAVLGAGTFGRVSLVQHSKSGDVFALKCMHKQEIVAHKQQKNCINEKNIMLLAGHPFILNLMNTYKDRYRIYMLLEFIQVKPRVKTERAHGVIPRLIMRLCRLCFLGGTGRGTF